MDLSQSVVFWPLFPGNWLLGHSVSGQMKPNHCPWNFRHLTWRLFYYSLAERDWFYQYSLFGVFITPPPVEKVVEKMGIFIFLCWVTAENTLYQNAEHLYESVSLCFLCFTRAGILILAVIMSELLLLSAHKHTPCQLTYLSQFETVDVSSLNLSVLCAFMHSNRYIDKNLHGSYANFCGRSETLPGILCADRKSKNVRLVENLLYMHCKISPWLFFEF